MSPYPHPQSGSLADSNFDLTPELESMFNALARAGRDDPAARNELYARLSEVSPASSRPGMGDTSPSGISPICSRRRFSSSPTW
jgi:hypothetical protein